MKGHSNPSECRLGQGSFLCSKHTSEDVQSKILPKTGAGSRRACFMTYLTTAWDPKPTALMWHPLCHTGLGWLSGLIRVHTSKNQQNGAMQNQKGVPFTRQCILATQLCTTPQRVPLGPWLLTVWGFKICLHTYRSGEPASLQS